MDSMLRENAGVRRLVAAWLLLALAALALSTCFAVFLVASRTPLPGGMAAPVTLFRSALVLHVSLAVVVWFLAGAAGLWTMAAGRAGLERWAAWIIACAGMLAMSAALFFGPSAPVLANYLPVLDSPVFLAGLAFFLSGVAICGLSSAGVFAGRLKRPEQLPNWHVGVILSMAVTLIALGAFAVSLALGGVEDIAGRFEIIAWGPGHLLQFVHVLLMMTAWIMLGEKIFATNILSKVWLIGLMLLAAAPVLAAPIIYLMFSPGSLEFRHAFTSLMTWGAWPAATLLACRLLYMFAKSGRTLWTRTEATPLLLSIVLFLLGCFFGASIRGESTMIPAHYHGTVGAVTLAYMMLGYRLLPSFGFAHRGKRLVAWQPVLYGVGLLILASALAWSGWLGVPRKTLHIDVIAQYPAYFAAMSLAGIGGLLAIVGAALFVFNMARSIWPGRERNAPQPGRRDVRLRAFGLMLGLVLVIGLAIAYWPSHVSEIVVAQPASIDSPGASKAEIDERFSQGVVMLHAKQFDNAATAFLRVLKLAPKMPEAHVNMGFAMVGLGRYEEARNSFESAITLRAMQANAYYGLAVALDGMGDMPGALGAMRTYVHLADQREDNYVRNARTAIGKWEETLKQAGGEEKKGQ